MKYLIGLTCCLAVLASCKAKEAQLMAEELKTSRAAAEKAIRSGDFSTDNLLIAQEYFFSFGEKTHLLRADPQSLKGVRRVLERSASQFCADFLLSKALWTKLDEYCRGGDSYRCSGEMQEFPKLVGEFKAALGSDAQSLIANASACRF